MGEQTGEGQLMVSWEIEVADSTSLTCAHPTQDEMIGKAAMALAGKPLYGQAWQGILEIRKPIPKEGNLGV